MTGLEPENVTNTPQSTYENTKKEKVQNGVHFSHFSPDLQEIINRWDGLPEHIKKAIKALIETHNQEQL